MAAQSFSIEALELNTLPLVQRPFTHVVRREFIEPHLFAELNSAFPICPAGSGPTGFSLYWKDSGYEQLLKTSPAWRALFHSFHCQAFIEWTKEQFGSELQKAGCRIDLERARYVSYCEDRVDKERARLRRVELEPHDLWVRMDIYQGRVGYARAIHRDHARRLLTLLIYFSDHTADGMTGGELVLYPTPWKRWSQSPTVVTPRENLMVAFPCTDFSYHSVAQITAARRPRNYIQVQISSSVDIWPRGTALGAARNVAHL